MEKFTTKELLECPYGLDFSDIYLIPDHKSSINTRSGVDVYTNVAKILAPAQRFTTLPVVSANMQFSGLDMVRAMRSAGAIGALHRFMSIEENVRYVDTLQKEKYKYFVSVGVNNDSKERAIALYKAGARNFIIDIANGYSTIMESMIKWMRNQFGDATLVAGNVSTMNGAYSLAEWGADGVKVGTGPGAACTTKNVTGTTVPQVSAILDCAEGLHRYTVYTGNTKPVLIADGGMREYGDIAKSIALGADIVMSGYLLCNAIESAAPTAPQITNGVIYSGSASTDVMTAYKENRDYLPTPEGESRVILRERVHVRRIIDDIKGALQSACSYSNAQDLDEFRANALFGVRHNR